MNLSSRRKRVLFPFVGDTIGGSHISALERCARLGSDAILADCCDAQGGKTSIAPGRPRSGCNTWARLAGQTMERQSSEGHNCLVLFSDSFGLQSFAIAHRYRSYSRCSDAFSLGSSCNVGRGEVRSSLAGADTIADRDFVQIRRCYRRDLGVYAGTVPTKNRPKGKGREQSGATALRH